MCGWAGNLPGPGGNKHCVTVAPTRLDEKWADTLKGYMGGGGTLVTNTVQLAAALDDSFLGAKVGKERKEASRADCLRDGSWDSEITLRPGEIRVFLVRTK